MSKDQKEYAEKTSKLTSLTNRIAEADKKFKELVHEKAETHSVTRKQELIKEMVEINKQRNKDVDDYNRLKAELTYRYPSEGESLNRRYQTQNKRSLEEMEGVVGLDEMLTRVKKTIDRKFAPFMEEVAPTKPKASPAQAAPEKPPRLRLER
ncbi:MAG: hypothetical protein HC902_12075 [Calothrix sp. SM1_5_4]|nr:hypothetical protein [Calothrix sp. SM1_5_4]